MAEKENKEVQQSAWNLSAILIEQIGYLLSGSSTSYRQGRIQSSFFDVEEVRNLIHTYLEKDERKTLDDLGTKICKLNSIWINLQNKYEDDLKDPIDDCEEGQKRDMVRMLKAKHLHSKYVKEYRRLIMEMLTKYGLGLSGKEDSSKMF